MASQGSIDPTDSMIWGWTDIDVIGWDDDTKIGGSIPIEEDVGSIDPT